MCGHIPWNTSPSHGFGLPGAAAREETGLDPDPAGRNFPRGFRVPFPSTDCTDTNFILQVLKTRSTAPPPAAPPPALAVGRGLTQPCLWWCFHVGLGAGDPPTTGALSPGLCPHVWPPGWAVPLPQTPVLEGTALTQGRPCLHPPTSKTSAGAPPAVGSVPWAPLTPISAGLQLSSHEGLWGTAGTAGAG